MTDERPIPSRPPRMSVEDVAQYYVHDDGTLWRLVGYCAYPTATLERVDAIDEHGTKPRVGGAVGARVFEGFRRLRPE